MTLGARSRLLCGRQDAILKGVWIEVDHQAHCPGKLSREIELGPTSLLFGEGQQYLLALSGWLQNLCLFALSGFERIYPSDGF